MPGTASPGEGAAVAPDPVGSMLCFEVGAEDTAIALGSGSVPVLATPRLIAWLEAATVVAVAGHLQAGETSVGTRISVAHLRPSAVGRQVTVAARLMASTDRHCSFEVWAEQSGTSGSERVAEGTVDRVVVSESRFLAGLES